MMLGDERYEYWEEDYQEDYLDEEDLNFMHEVYDSEDEYSIDILMTNEEYHSLDIQFECCAPIWSVLDSVSEFFESRGLKTAEIVSMTTEAFDDDSLVLRVIYTV